MKTLALATLCAILSQCHARESPLSRPKRTLRMLESLFGSMRDTFGPLTAPAAQPPSEVILATKYPVGVKYALYPTVRMHIRPIQQHVIYMQSIPQSIPTITGPVLRPVRPLNTGAVEILRPMVRLPKTQTTTTIHYEIIPLPVPVHSEPPSPPAFSSPPSFSAPPSYASPSSYSAPEPPPPPPPPSLSSSPFSYDETDDPSAPWSLDELPPPVPTSAPLNPLDEPNVPWNLHALPPPVATKQPRGNEAFAWPMRSVHPHSMDGSYAGPAVFDKRLVIPAQSVGSHNRHRSVFRPSQLQSEISVQPSVELAAYSETQTHTQTLAQQPNEYVNRLRNLNSPRPQVFPHRNNRLRREAPPTYFIDGDHRMVRTSPHQPSVERRISSSALAAQRSDTLSGHGSAPGSSARPQSAPPAFASGRQLAPAIGHDIRVSASLPETPAERYVIITPRPVDYSRRVTDSSRVETRQASGFSSTSGPRSSNLLRSSTLDDERRRPPERSELSAWLDRAKGRLRFPPTGALSKAPRRPQPRPSFFSSKSPPLSVDNFFDDRSTESPSSAAKGHGDQFWLSDLDNVEYFEPIIIDIGGDADDKKHRRTDLAGSKVEFKLNGLEPKRSTRREPLRLPGRLHETVDRLSQALMHPPIFDVESEANEPHSVVVLLANEIT